MCKGRQTPAASIALVSHAYGSRLALDRVSFEVAPANLTVLLGLNGAGKSTLFALMTRLYPVRRGRIRLFGHDVERATSRALRTLGVVFQSRTLDLDLSVVQNLLYDAALHGIGGYDARQRADGVLARVSLRDRARDKVRNLSGGQMRRVEIARALIHRPRFLLLDEATAGLDIKSRTEILTHVRRLVTEDGIGVLWATHLMDEVNDADHVVVLHRGRVLADAQGSRIITENGARDMRDAFSRLTFSDDESAAA